MNQNYWARKVFDDWLKERNTTILENGSEDLMFLSDRSSDGHEKLEFISKVTLNLALKFFFHEVRKKNGDVYPGETLRLLLCGIQRYIRSERKLDWKVRRFL